MQQLWTSLGTGVFTVLTGFSIFTLGQLAVKMVLEPILELKRNIGLTVHLILLNQASIYNNSASPETLAALGSLSANLLSASQSAPKSVTLRLLLGAPLSPDVLEASRSLNGLYHTLSEHQGDEMVYKQIQEHINSIEIELGVKLTFSEN